MKEFNTFIREFTEDVRKEYKNLARGTPPSDLYTLGKIQKIALEHVAKKYKSQRAG
ncbi:hypothetical protein [Mitsuokella sp.]|uniref:hypothetical protein n=1 Tax=Mitsuokella sp. TaxID=2049034 RepID=UPI002A815CAD|nr:hypothetical protein [Mitsuokella sp.]MDY4474595.1 hypothetical protein [Mitsuokella sp.]